MSTRYDYDEDRELVENSQNGKQEAFEMLVEAKMAKMVPGKLFSKSDKFYKKMVPGKLFYRLFSLNEDQEMEQIRDSNHGHPVIQKIPVQTFIFIGPGSDKDLYNNRADMFSVSNSSAFLQ